ncbi:MAG: UDP-N-acetylmuramoyl-tripeptide--D-alanyl-D-alanine ligase [Fusobacterium sp.]|nr:UDP-N-acetylmuramoyl-tripeptide--D-alanyl-D-alanine ligase [Fusobacterium sp.]
MKLEEIIKASGAKVIKTTETIANIDISTDTRTIKNGDIYLPLKGANFDGENFLDKAIESGAVGCFITRDEYPENAQIVLKVENTLETYLKLANFHRHKIAPKVVAITGSSGKTTTKEMVFAVLKEKFNTVKTLSNHNNEIGLCQTIFSTDEKTEVLIVEMGMRGLGEIELLSRYAEPDIAIITNAGTAHLGRLGSLDNIAIAKCEIAQHLNPQGKLIAHDNERIRKFNNFAGEKLFYSIADAKVLERKAGYTKFIYKENEYEIFTEGDFNVENSISAIETGLALGLSPDEIKRGLASYKPIEKRWEAERVADLNLINDSYNANPDSMKASVGTFLRLYPQPVVVLGDMGELGESEAEHHAQVGEELAKIAPKGTKFLTVGSLSRNIANALKDFDVTSVDTNKEAAEFLRKMPANSNVFLKASRSMKFEEIINYLKEI